MKSLPISGEELLKLAYDAGKLSANQKELYEKGAILEHGSVDCYLLGETIEKGENSNRTDRDGGVIIRPLIYDTILKRAETRMLHPAILQNLKVNLVVAPSGAGLAFAGLPVPL